MKSTSSAFSEVSGKVLLITGASRGIGRATAIMAGASGAKVAVNYITQKKLADEVVQLMKGNGGEAMDIQGDVAIHDDVKRIIRQTISSFGRIDILINNAGLVSWKPMMDERLEFLHRMIDVNIKGVVNMTYTVIPVMQKQKNGGVIVNVASGAGKTGYPNLAVYSATKFAVIGFTQGIGDELKEKHIRVYAVCPGMTATDMTGFSGMPPEKIARRILEAATEQLGLKSGEDTEIYE